MGMDPVQFGLTQGTGASTGVEYQSYLTPQQRAMLEKQKDGFTKTQAAEAAGGVAAAAAAITVGVAAHKKGGLKEGAEFLWNGTKNLFRREAKQAAEEAPKAEASATEQVSSEAASETVSQQRHLRDRSPEARGSIANKALADDHAMSEMLRSSKGFSNDITDEMMKNYVADAKRLGITDADQLAATAAKNGWAPEAVDKIGRQFAETDTTVSNATHSWSRSRSPEARGSIANRALEDDHAMSTMFRTTGSFSGSMDDAMLNNYVQMAREQGVKDADELAATAAKNGWAPEAVDKIARKFADTDTSVSQGRHLPQALSSEHEAAPINTVGKRNRENRLTINEKALPDDHEMSEMFRSSQGFSKDINDEIMTNYVDMVRNHGIQDIDVLAATATKNGWAPEAVEKITRQFTQAENSVSKARIPSQPTRIDTQVS